MRMALRVDVGIHPDRDARDGALSRGNRFDARQLARRFDVDGLQTERHGAFELGHRLPDAGEDDVPR